MPLKKHLAFIAVTSLTIAACCNSVKTPSYSEAISNQTNPSNDAEQDLSTTVRTQRGNPEIEQQLEAIVLNDPQLDAIDAIKSGSICLWAYNSRSGKIVPGSNPQNEQALKNLKTRTAPGMGDVIYGNKHQKLRKQFIEYATIYNQTILQTLGK